MRDSQPIRGPDCRFQEQTDGFLDRNQDFVRAANDITIRYDWNCYRAVTPTITSDIHYVMVLDISDVQYYDVWSSMYD